MGKATSSMTTVVPILRAPPTAGNRPLRTSQSFSNSAFTSVNFTGWSFFTSSTRRVASSACFRRSARSGARISTSRAQAVGPSSASPAACRASPGPQRIEARSISSTADTSPPAQALDGDGGVLDVREEHQRAGLVGMVLDGEQRHLGDEGQRPLRAHQQMEQDVDRVVEVDEGVEAVAGGVLDPVLLADAPGQRLVGGDLVADGAAARRGARRASPEVAAGRPDRRCRASVPSASTSRMPLHRLVAVLRGAAAHAGGVVGDDAARSCRRRWRPGRGRSCAPAGPGRRWPRRR